MPPLPPPKPALDPHARAFEIAAQREFEERHVERWVRDGGVMRPRGALTARRVRLMADYFSRGMHPMHELFSHNERRKAR